MRVLLSIAIAVVACASPSSEPQARLTHPPLPQAEAAEVGMSATGLARIEPAMQRWVDEGRVAGIVTMVARRGRLVHWDAVGYRDLESKAELRKDDIFRIYSMTKPVTSVAVMMLVEEGKLALTDHVSRYLPAFANVMVYADGARVPPRRPITIEDLLRHTSGLSYGPPIGRTEVDAMYAEAGVFAGDLATLVERVAALPLVDHPGARWNYGVSTDVLGRLVEVVSGQPFGEFLERRIFTPLGMADTGFVVPDADGARVPAVYGRGRGGIQVVDPPLGLSLRSRPALVSGGGGLVSTAADYVRFAQALLNGGELEGTRLLRPETVTLMRTNGLDTSLIPIGFGPQRLAGYGFGLGFSVLVDEDATPVPDHDGVFRWMGIGSTYFWIDPQAELVAIVLTQFYPLLWALETEFQTLVYGAIQN